MVINDFNFIQLSKVPSVNVIEDTAPLSDADTVSPYDVNVDTVPSCDDDRGSVNAVNIDVEIDKQKKVTINYIQYDYNSS